MDAKRLWSKRQAEAMKILGDGAEVPDVPGTIQKAVDEVEKAGNAFLKSCSAIEDELLGLDNAYSSLRNAMEQFRAKIEKTTFKLDQKADAKKIDQAREVLLGYLDENIDSYKANDKKIDDLNRLLVQLQKLSG